MQLIASPWKVGLFSLAASSAAAGAVCPPLNPAGLRELAQAGPQHVVFFASWCSSCKDHLMAKAEPRTIFIAAFDRRDRAEAVMEQLNRNARCYTDDGIAASLGVVGLPASRDVP